jgi:hypothetical protein
MHKKFVPNCLSKDNYRNDSSYQLPRGVDQFSDVSAKSDSFRSVAPRP